MKSSIRHRVCSFVRGNLIENVFSPIPFPQIKEVAPPQNQHRLWEHDIKIARNYNTTAQTDSGDNLTASQQLVTENLTNLKKNDEKINRLYGQACRSNWSGMHSEYPMYDATISDLEGVSLCMEYPTRPTPIRSQFDTKPIRIQSSSRNRSSSSTSPPSPSSSKMSQPRSPSLFSNFQSMSKFRLEKIPEVPPTPLSSTTTTTAAEATSSNENQDTINSTDNSTNSREFTKSSDNIK